MTAFPVSLELHGIQSRTRRLVSASAVIHAILVLWMSFLPPPAPPVEGVTEITWIELKEPEPAAPPPAPEPRAAAAEEPTPALPAPSQTKKQFVRETPLAEHAPQPQDLAAVEDKLRERLTSMQTQARDQRTQIAALAAPAPSAPTPASLPGVGRGAPTELSRGSAPSAPPAELTRATPAAATPSPALSRLSDRPAPAAPAVATKSSSDIREILDGITLSGPVADRALVSYRPPDFPEWAKTEGVEGSVRVYFEVLPDGRVKRNALVDKTSGFRDFDQNALVALLEWRFEPLAKGAVGEQWGSITLNYRLDH
jgi:TonB family protein